MKDFLTFMLETLLLIFIVMFSFIQYLKSDYNTAFDHETLSELKTKLKITKPVSASFIKVYSELNAITNTNGVLFDALNENYNRDCPCLNVARSGVIKRQNSLMGNEYVLAWKLEKEFTQEQCLYYYIKNVDLLYNNKSMYSTSGNKFNSAVFSTRH